MDLLKTFESYAADGKAVEKAAFEAAMKEKLANEPYRMADLLFEVYSCRRDVENMGLALQHAWIEIEGLEDMIVGLEEQLDALEEKRKKKKKCG